MKRKKLHMIGNAHLDPVWLWQWQEGFQEAKATFRSALDRIKESDDFLFTSSSAAIYEWIEWNDPEMFAEIKQRIAEGRWEIVGGWWIQPDCNIPNGESFVRQGLYGQRYFKEKFGVTAKVGYNVDSFGHFGMLPQILKKSGMDYYVMMRPMPNEKGLPGRLFQWESDDGSRVLTFRIMYEYLSWGKEVDYHVSRCAKELKEPADELMCFYGVGNHGGGPTKENIESIRRLNDDPEYPALIFSTPNRFFHEVEKKKIDYPVVHDDLQHHASGCYAAHSGVKVWNRKAENKLIAAEKLSSVASWVTSQPYPGDFNQAWKSVLFNQFHDILAGTSIEPAYEDARNSYGEAITIADRNLNCAIQSMSWKINIEQEEAMKPIVVFNPHSWVSKTNVELEIGGEYEDGMMLTDEKGEQLACQKVQSLAQVRRRHRISFIAELPALGYRVYKLWTKPAAKKLDTPPVASSDTLLENDRFRLEIDPVTGYIRSLYDKVRAIEVFSGREAAKPVVIEDNSDTWSHNVLHFNKVIGAFTATSVKRIEYGPVKSVIRVVSEFGSSKIIQDFALYRELDQIDVTMTVDWREQFKMLKLVFPVNLFQTRQTYEIPYGSIEREHNGEEEPGQGWVDITGMYDKRGSVYGLSLINDAKYSYSIDKNELAMTVIRSPIYAHHDPVVPDPNIHYSFIDQGIQTFHYTLLPHESGWEDAGTVKAAAELNQRPTVIIETYHEGTLPQTDSFLTIDRGNIVLGALKKAEDNQDLILRLYETNKVAIEATISLPRWNRKFKASFGPCEIKTFRIPLDEQESVTETNMLEEM